MKNILCNLLHIFSFVLICALVLQLWQGTHQENIWDFSVLTECVTFVVVIQNFVYIIMFLYYLCYQMALDNFKSSQSLSQFIFSKLLKAWSVHIEYVLHSKLQFHSKQLECCLHYLAFVVCFMYPNAIFFYKLPVFY